MSARELGAICVLVLAIAACERTAARPPNEAANGLVIPPIGAEADQAAQATPPRPAERRSALAFPARDPRLSRRPPRSRALVLTEVKGLERLLDASGQTSIDRPTLRRRLAESYNELAYTSDGAHAERARDEAIKHYDALKDDHPQYPQRDEVLYYLGLAYELKGEAVWARREYLELIRSMPSSKLVPLAYFAFGEIFFVESATDPSKLDLAFQAFTEVLKYPPPDNPIHPETLLRLGQTQLRRENDVKASVLFDRLRREYPDSAAAAEIPPGH